MASDTSSKARCCASVEAAGGSRVGFWLTIRRITPGFAAAQILGRNIETKRARFDRAASRTRRITLEKRLPTLSQLGLFHLGETSGRARDAREKTWRLQAFLQRPRSLAFDTAFPSGSRGNGD